MFHKSRKHSGFKSPRSNTVEAPFFIRHDAHRSARPSPSSFGQINLRATCYLHGNRSTCLLHFHMSCSTGQLITDITHQTFVIGSSITCGHTKWKHHWRDILSHRKPVHLLSPACLSHPFPLLAHSQSTSQ